MAIIAYLRVSTDEQAQSGLGLDAQLDAIKRVVGAPDAVYRDEGYSGSDQRRPALLEVLEALREGDVLAVAKRDRLARDVYYSAWIAKEAKRRGARITSAAGEGTENDDPASVLLQNIVDAFAQYERDMIRARTAAALEQKRKRGEKTGGEVPFGYQLAEDGVHLESDESEQKVLDLVRQLREKGESLRKIAVELERRGVLSRRGKTHWHPQTIKQMLEQKTDLTAKQAA